MGSVGRGENRAIFKLQEIGSEFREINFQTHRFQRDRCESQADFVMIDKKNRTVVVWLLGYWTAMKVVAMMADRITDDRQFPLVAMQMQLEITDICLHSISQTMQLYGIPSNATVSCRFGMKIPVRLPLLLENDYKRCLDAGILYLHHLVETDNNVTLSTCHDTTFIALASQFDNASAVEVTSCFFPLGISSFLLLVFVDFLLLLSCRFLPSHALKDIRGTQGPGIQYPCSTVNREGRARPLIKQVLRLLYESSDPMHIGFVRAVEDEECEGTGRSSKGKSHKSDTIFQSGDGRYLASSSSTSRSYCTRSFLLEGGSPQSPSSMLSV
ncbi:hypothetical protein SADUNF_Sadunf04G0104600 [Salix dunnii]|uniref:Uncharacterized protein n=1 Tax=Salix dunnii TaxID=1413687 RepID=A0A835N400_9ROSI|nr:hypothetical protein SADUNF_Sadunf04G0104600 [Salix dunnii]